MAVYDPMAPCTNLRAAAGLGDQDDQYLLVKFDSEGMVEPTATADDLYVGVMINSAFSASKGASVKVYTGGNVPVRTSTAAAIAVGDSLVPAAGGKVVKKTGAQDKSDRLIALEASSSADNIIQAFLRTPTP